MLFILFKQCFTEEYSKLIKKGKAVIKCIERCVAIECATLNAYL